MQNQKKSVYTPKILFLVGAIFMVLAALLGIFDLATGSILNWGTWIFAGLFWWLLAMIYVKKKL